MYGISDPLESEEMKAKDLFSTFMECYFFLLFQFEVSNYQ